jgi:hypothetical protein
VFLENDYLMKFFNMFLVFKIKSVFFKIGGDALNLIIWLCLFKIEITTFYFTLLFQNSLEFSQIFLNPLAVMCNSCLTASWKLHIVFFKYSRNLHLLPKRL